MPQPNPLTIARVLDKAADLIEPEGAWTQGEYGRNKKGQPVHARRSAVCFCLYGAINAARRRPLDTAVVGELFEHLKRGVPETEFPWFWNDTPGRTQAEVVTALREAAAKARESAQ